MKSKKSLFGILGLALIAVIGATFAYYMSSTTFQNVFNTGKYKVTATEEFVSPDNWQPGDEIDKVITAENKGTVDAAIRINLSERWQDLEGHDITDQITSSPAIINYGNTEDWIQEGNYYYYKFILKPEDVTSSLIRSVTLDPDLNSVVCTGTGNTRDCQGTNPATGAKYYLTATIQTIQYDKYRTEWTSNVDIIEKKLITIPSNRTADTLVAGDEICINGDSSECFNFIGYDGNNIKMLAKYNLKVGNIIKSSVVQRQYASTDYGYNLQSRDALAYDGDSTHSSDVQFSGTNYWYDTNNDTLISTYGSSYPAWVYDNTNKVSAPVFTNGGTTEAGYSVAYYVEAYKDILEDYGVTVSEARLLKYSEATGTGITCDGSNNTCPTNGFITNTSFWLGDAEDKFDVWSINTNGAFVGTYFDVGYSYGVRPVIVIAKSSIQS